MFQKNNWCLCTVLDVNNVLLELQCLQSTTCPFLHCFYFLWNDPGVITSQKINGLFIIMGISVFLWIGCCHNLRGWGRRRAGSTWSERGAGSVLQPVKIVPGEGQVRDRWGQWPLGWHWQSPWVKRWALFQFKILMVPVMRQLYH